MNPPMRQEAKLRKLTARRLALRDERNLIILGLDAIIASNEATIAEKENALREKRYLNTLTEKELLLEMQSHRHGLPGLFRARVGSRGLTSRSLLRNIR